MLKFSENSLYIIQNVQQLKVIETLWTIRQIKLNSKQTQILPHVSFAQTMLQQPLPSGHCPVEFLALSQKVKMSLTYAVYSVSHALGTVSPSKSSKSAQEGLKFR